MPYNMAGMPGNKYKAGLPKGMSGFPAVGGGLGGLPVRKSGAVLRMGTPIAFSADVVTGLRRGSVATMTPTQFIAAYTDYTTTKVCLLDVVGRTVSAGSPYTYTARTPVNSDPSIISYDATRALLSVPVESANTLGLRLTNTGGTFSNSEFLVGGMQYWSNHIWLGSNTYLRSRRDVTNNDLRVGVDTFDGTTLTRGTPISIAIAGSPGSSHALIGLSGGRGVLIHQNPSQSGRIEASVVTASGVSTTFNSTTAITGGLHALLDAVALDDSRILVTYYVGGGDQYAVVLTVTGTSVAVGVPKWFGPNAGYGSLHAFSSGMCVALWRDTLLDASLRYSFLTVSGTSVSASKEAVLSTEQIYGSTIVGLSNTQALFVYSTNIPAWAVKAAVLTIG